jgi:hypothetical protein
MGLFGWAARIQALVGFCTVETVWRVEHRPLLEIGKADTGAVVGRERLTTDGVLLSRHKYRAVRQIVQPRQSLESPVSATGTVFIPSYVTPYVEGAARSMA